MVQIDTASARLIVTLTKTAKLGLNMRPNPPVAVFHLGGDGERFVIDQRNPPPDPSADIAEQLSAIRIDGQVDLSLEPSDRLDAWEFRFLQFARSVAKVAVYLGRTPSEGMLEFDLSKPPLTPARLAMNWCLDSEPGSMPFFNHRTPNVMDQVVLRGPRIGQKVAKGKTVTATMDDHPNQVIPLKFTDQLLLYRAIMSFEALTIFVARNQGRITPLAHLRWWATWDWMFTWVGDTPTPIKQKSSFDADAWAKGLPPNPAGLADMVARAAKITDPNADTSETYNAITRSAGGRLKDLTARGPGGDGWAVARYSQEHGWPDHVPSNFYRP